MTSAEFSEEVLAWYERWGRKSLPWQQSITPYRVWVSEIMLQQTQVATVIPYYERFMSRFPTVETLASAGEDDVLAHWSGLGYYARGRNLHRAAKQVMEQHGGVFPIEMDALQALPGIGRSTAAAIVSIAGGGAEAILDGNVKRVLARFYAIEGWPGTTSVQKQLWMLAENLMPASGAREYTQAMMDLGATVCTRSRPACDRCPVVHGCKAHSMGTPTAFPEPKPKKKRPLKARRFLMLSDHSGNLLLEKRSSQGLWGGLWSLPEFELAEDWQQEIRTLFAVRIETMIELPSLRHAFSHYELDMLPIMAQVVHEGVKEREMASEELVWYNTAQPLPGGVPAPVARLIESFRSEHARLAGA